MKSDRTVIPTPVSLNAASRGWSVCTGIAPLSRSSPNLLAPLFSCEGIAGTHSLFFAQTPGEGCCKQLDLQLAFHLGCEGAGTIRVSGENPTTEEERGTIIKKTRCLLPG